MTAPHQCMAAVDVTNLVKFAQQLNMYNKHKDVTVDEALIPFKGRSSTKQYIPGKEDLRSE